MWCDDAMSSNSSQSNPEQCLFIMWKGKHNAQFKLFGLHFTPRTAFTHPLPPFLTMFQRFYFHYFQSRLYFLFPFFWKDPNLIKYDSMLKSERLVKCKWSSSENYAFVSLFYFFVLFVWRNPRQILWVHTTRSNVHSKKCSLINTQYSRDVRSKETDLPIIDRSSNSIFK